MNILVLTVILLVIIYFYIILYNSKKSNDRQSYYLYNNKLNAPLLTVTIVATQVGGGMIMGVADAAYEMGFAGLFYPIGIIIGLLIISLGLGDLFKKAKIPTISAIFEKKYKFPAARKFSSIISSISLFSITVAQGVAIRNLLHAIGLTEEWVFILIWVGVITYTSLGGIKAVVQTNMVQILFITIALSILLYSTISNVNFDSLEIVSKNVQYYSVLEWLIWPCCYTLIEQDMAQLFFSAKSKQIVKKSTIIAAICILILAIVPATIGIIAKTQIIPLASNKGILLLFAKSHLSTTVYAITAIAVILAITSTVDSLLCAVSSNIAYDFSIPISRIKYISSEVIITFLIGIGSLIVVFYCENIIKTLMFSYGLCVSGLFVSSLCGFLLPSNKLKKSSAILSILFGICSFIILSIAKSNFTYLAILLSAIGYGLPMIASKKQ